MFSTQPSMFDLDDAPTVTPLAGRPERIELTCGAWIDRVPGWLTGSDELLARLLADVPWRAERREMFEREVDVPRLLANYGRGATLPHPVLDQARDALNQHYAAELGEPFVTAGLCLYRDGRDSVAWHGDRLGKGRSADTMIAILGVGRTGSWRCGNANRDRTGVAAPNGSRPVTVICWSWAGPVSAPGTTPSRRRRRPSARGSASSSGPPEWPDRSAA